jgi:hypothetical protein
MAGHSLAAADGQWPRLLIELAGLNPEQLQNRHQPCPACGGTDRYRWDRDDGPGGWFCNQCGGKDHTGGGGNGMDLLMRLTGWARAFGATSPSNAWAIGDTSSQANRLGQSKGRSPSVFNFFRPGYTPPNTAIATAGLVAPEFQITNEQTVVAYVNYMQSLIVNGAGDFRADYGAILALAGDSAALVDEVNLLIAAGQLSSATVSSIRAAVDSIAATGTAGPANRVYTAILLTLASPDYLTFR